ncbi:hypothetical protein QYE76_002868 [Lolium multiflorum]|uniref:FRIGIDA-like protein n=1 Tax=Lolium multiflorum TaxID=4521 RepID=A0AAD8RP23_LOLMU|nr:hypothetical protein QYE76_002868 [Lolium multiflorum]
MTTTDLGSAEWERSKISGQDINMLKKMGFSKKEDALQFPKEESYPKPPIDYRGHLVLASLPPLPEGGEVEDRAVVDDDNQSTARPATEIAGSHKSAASAESDATASTHSLPHASKRKRDEVKDSGTSKAEEAEPSYKKAAFNPYTDALVSSDEEEEEQTVDAAARTSTSRTLIVSEAQHDGDETSPPQQDIVQPPPVESPRASPSKRARIEPSKEPIQFPGGSSTPSLDDPLMKEFIRLGTQFVGYRDYTKKLEGDLAETNKRADALAVKLEQSEEARQKAEKDAATIEDLRKRLHDAETSLSNNIARQSAREAEILSRLESQTRRFIRRTHQEYEIEGPEGDELLDALTLVEIHGDEARDGLENAEASLLKLFPYFFPKKEAPILLTLSLVYGTMFPRNKMPETLPALMDKFRDAPRIHGFVRAQLAAGARFAMIMIKICYPKLDVGQIVPKCLAKMAKRKKNFGKYDDIVTPVAEDMMDELLRMDSEFFVKGSYAEHSTRAINNERLTIDNILGNP